MKPRRLFIRGCRAMVMLGDTDERARLPRVRATGVLVKEDEILLVKQVLRERSNWNLPGGGLEVGETLEQCLVREMSEETGLDVEVGELLYICDRFKGLHAQILDISFLLSCSDDTKELKLDSIMNDEHLDAICMVPLNTLEHYGFSDKFAWLIREGFPGKGSYKGDFHTFYGLR